VDQKKQEDPSLFNKSMFSAGTKLYKVILGNDSLTSVEKLQNITQLATKREKQLKNFYDPDLHEKILAIANGPEVTAVARNNVGRSPLRPEQVETLFLPGMSPAIPEKMDHQRVLMSAVLRRVAQTEGQNSTSGLLLRAMGSALEVPVTKENSHEFQLRLMNAIDKTPGVEKNKLPIQFLHAWENIRQLNASAAQVQNKAERVHSSTSMSSTAMLVDAGVVSKDRSKHLSASTSDASVTVQGNKSQGAAVPATAAPATDTSPEQGFRPRK